MDTVIKGFEYYSWNWEEKGVKGTTGFIHCTKSSNSSIGECFEKLKFKAENQTQIFGTDDLKTFIGKKCHINYDRYGRVSSVQIVR